MRESDPATCQPLEAGASDDQQMLTERRAAVRADLATDTTGAANALRHAIDRAATPACRSRLRSWAPLRRSSGGRAWSVSSLPPSGPWHAAGCALPAEP
jgi:hypothetical protein